MKLLLVNAPIELTRQLIERHRMERDVHVAVAGSGNAFQLKLFDPNEAGDEPVFVPVLGRRKINLQAIAALRKTIRALRPDVVHAFLPASLAQTVIACAGMRNRPRIVSFYGITRVPRWYDPANMISYLSPTVDMHACESQAVKESMLLGGVREQRCQVVYNCVAPSIPTTDRDALRAELDIPADAFVIGTVAAIRPVKGVDLLLKAAAACSDIPNCYVVVAGQLEDPAVASLCQHPALQGRLRMLGYVPNAADKIDAFDLFVMPSRREGLCRALLEGMERGVCPIVSDAGGMKELVRHQIDGLVVPREDVSALEFAIRRLHRERELRSLYARSAQARVRSICAPGIFADRMLHLYRDVCA